MLRILIFFIFQIGFLFGENARLDFYSFVEQVSKNDKINILIDKNINKDFNFYFADSLKINLDMLQSVLNDNDLEILDKKGYFYIQEIAEDNLIKDKVLKTAIIPFLDSNKTIEIAKDFNITANYINKDKYILKGSLENIKDFKKIMLKITKPKTIRITGEILELQDNELENIGIDIALFSNNINTGKGVAVSFKNALGIDTAFSGILPSGFTKFSLISAINFLKKQGLAKTLTTPNLIITEDTETKFHFGESIPIMKQETQNLNKETPLNSKTYTTIETGLIINCSARTHYNFIDLNMEINFIDILNITDGQATTSNRNYSGSFYLRNGQTVLLAGLTKETTNNKEISVPIISNVPIMGEIFKHKYQDSNRNSIFIYFTARIE